jgi:hypothetical protein
MTVIFALIVTVPTLALGGEKVTICHYPPGNSDNPHTISVNESTLDEHLAHGDQLGECPCPATPCPASVKVVNGESEPIPVKGETTVSGSVNIEGTVNVNIEAEGTPDVSIKGTPDVNVVNDSSNPVPIADVTNPRELIMIKAYDCTAQGGHALYSNIPCFVHMYDMNEVPDGKRLVIEYFSCAARLKNGETIACYLETCEGRVDIPNTPIPPIIMNNLKGLRTSGQKVKMYTWPNWGCFVNAWGYPSNFDEIRDVYIQFSLTGYLEDDI